MVFEVGGEERTIEVLTNHLELHIESKRVSASCIRFYGLGRSAKDKKKKKEGRRRTTLSSSYNI